MAARPGLRRLLDQRGRLQDQALDNFDANMVSLSENMARRLGSVLDVDPDTIFPKRGDDGVSVGKTDFETRLSELSDGERLRASVLLTSLSEVEDFIEASGMDRTRKGLREAVGKLSGLSERSFAIQGVAGAVGSLDTVSAEALIMGHYEMAIEDGLIGIQKRQAAIRIKEALAANLGLVPMRQLAKGIAESEIQSIPKARTEARTRMAQADRVAHEIVRKTLDPEEEQFLVGYMGPRAGGNIRPFCRALVGKAFAPSELEGVDNAQVGNVLTSAGGYNCRHYLTPIRADELDALGLVRGTGADIESAEGGARKGKK